MTTRSDRFRKEIGLEKLTGSARILAEEAERTIARLDTIHHFVHEDGEDWFGLANRLGNEVDLTINAPLAELRQQALALRALLSELRAVLGSDKVLAAPPTSQADELKKRRDERRQASGAV